MTYDTLTAAALVGFIIGYAVSSGIENMSDGGVFERYTYERGYAEGKAGIPSIYKRNP